MAKYYLTANQIITDVAYEEGLDVPSNFITDTAVMSIQLQGLLDICIEELAVAHQWEEFNREESFTTNSGTNPTGEYDLPTDFHYMVDQTHWDRTNDLPLGGPLSAQDWQYMYGFGLNTSTIYASFRQKQGKLALWPAPPSDGIEVYYEYQSNNWIRNAADTAYLQRIAASGDKVLFPPTLIRAYLRAKFRGSKGLSTITAAQAVAYFMESAGGFDKAAPILSASRRSRGFPYLDKFRNSPDTGYGS